MIETRRHDRRLSQIHTATSQIINNHRLSSWDNHFHSHAHARFTPQVNNFGGRV
ncbi:hypothetical protein RMSM_03449 [Rhodopirellula maiorica SM1]|uniref:Uncharacterized protein n=1 Tax=Rhodopirellula maiorica SM1 TaxID=1265738 RepID=M5RW62_9BACT|nr:hypothetical protein RMSM_03449 [Rhodopirellula maiorica SM1]